MPVRRSSAKLRFLMTDPFVVDISNCTTEIIASTMKNRFLNIFQFRNFPVAKRYTSARKTYFRTNTQSGNEWRMSNEFLAQLGKMVFSLCRRWYCYCRVEFMHGAFRWLLCVFAKENAIIVVALRVKQQKVTPIIIIRFCHAFNLETPPTPHSSFERVRCAFLL